MTPKEILTEEITCNMTQGGDKWGRGCYYPQHCTTIVRLISWLFIIKAKRSISEAQFLSFQEECRHQKTKSCRILSKVSGVLAYHLTFRPKISLMGMAARMSPQNKPVDQQNGRGFGNQKFSNLQFQTFKASPFPGDLANILKRIG